ncbi:MAG: sugar phosphate nucleotidyltransferase [Thermoplasmatota archaeon]
MAGGEGTRLRPITLTRPKPFVPVGGKPCIEFVIDSLRRADVRDVMVTTFYKPEELVRHLGSGERFGVNVGYSVEDSPRGTAGGVRKVLPWIDDTFVVASGDVFADFDLVELVDFHKKRGAVATIALTRVDRPSEFGIVGLASDGRVERFQEKPRAEEAFSNLVNAGIYVLEPDAFRYVPEGIPFDFSRELFPRLLQENEALFAHELAGTWIDIGRPADLLRASKLVAERAGGNVALRGSRIDPHAHVAFTAVHPQAVVDADAIVEDSIVLDGARVAEGAVVRRSVVGANARIASKAFLEDCVVGDGAVIPGSAHLTGMRIEPGATAPA